MAGRYDDDDDDSPFDRNGLLKDGRTTRVSMMARDGLSDMQRAIMADKAASQFDDSSCRHQLGPISYDRSTAMAAYEDAKREACEAWKTPSADPAAAVWDTSARKDHEVARLHDTGDAKRDAYLDYVADLTSAWQRGR